MALSYLNETQINPGNLKTLIYHILNIIFYAFQNLFMKINFDDEIHYQQKDINFIQIFLRFNFLNVKKKK